MNVAKSTTFSMTKSLLNKTFKNGKFLNSLLPTLRDELAKALTSDLDESSVLLSQNRICKLFDYTVAGGKFARSSLAMQTFTVICLSL